MASLPEELWKRWGSFADGLRKQAPAARMIGKFAVRSASAEAERRLSSIIKHDPPTPPVEE